MLDNWFVIAGLVASVITLLSGVGKLAQGMWHLARQLVRFADALPALLKLPEDFAEHTADDREFQEWAMGRLERADSTEGFSS